MADSETEDETFVKKVITELSAFQKSDTSDETEQASESVNKDKKQEMNGPEHSLEAVGKEIPKAENGAMEENKTEPEKCGSVAPEAAKQPSRVIRLSRPYNPYSSTRTAVTSVSASSSAAAPAQSSTVTNGGGSSSAVGPGAPGSRLAALQRPGSPMHRILQRAQSPALAAAARLSRQASGDGAQIANNTEPTQGVSSTEQAQSSGAQQTAESKTADAPEQGNSDNATTQSRSKVPPRIQSSNLTGSILLRRPRSPLNTGKSQLLIHKQTSYPNNDGTSPKSPLSPGQGSPKDSLVSTSMEDSQTADKVAIRNKLRANSFRLKDLLTKKPFVRSREGNTDENSEDGSQQNSANENGVKNESVEDSSNKVSEAAFDKTRWRREGLTSLSRSKSTASDRTATLISARYLRTRTRNNPRLPTEGKDNGNGDNDKSSAKVENENNSSKVESEMRVNNIEKCDNAETDSKCSERIVEEGKESANKHDIGVAGSAQVCRGTTGATLLRSPRTRTPSGSSNVPCSPVEKSASQNGIEGISKDNINSQSDSNDFNKFNSDSDSKIKAISNLEKDNDVNLVFDSDTIGQSVMPVDSVKDTSQREMEYRRSQSEFTGSQHQTEESHKLHRNYSEPTSPNKEQSSMRGSKSYDTNPETDFPKSPALKRSLAVTDLDKAMRDRDQQKLSTIFKENSKEGVEAHSKVPSSEDKTEVLKHQDSQLETDLDARLIPAHRLVTSSPRIRQRMTGSQEGPRSPPHSAPPVNPVAPMVYKPNINLEDAVKWPIDIPGKLDFRKMEVFEGQMLLNWLSSSIDKSHYLRLVMTKHDINVIACQVCTCLIAAGVMKQIEGKDPEGVFKTDCMYYWTHTQQNSPNVSQDVNKLQPMWPPTQEQTKDNRPGLKYTEADHQAAMVTLRHEYKEEVDTIKREHEGVLDKARQEYENRLQQAIERIALLQKDVEKYKCLAGIEKYSQNALSEADAAQIEAGLKPEGVNGFATPTSQYHTPAGTPDTLNSNYPVNVVKSANELFGEFKTPSEGLQDGASCSGSDTTSLAGSIGEWSEGGTTLVPPPPVPPPPPGMAPPPAPPLPEALLKRPLKPVVNPLSPMRPLFWNRIQVNDVKTLKHKEYFEKKLVWEDLLEEKIDVQELDQLFSKRNVEPSRRFSPNKPKNKAKQVAKVISPKRSQVIGILLSSLRLEMSDIEHAILTFDTSQLGEEKLRQIYENRGDGDEMKKIKEHMKKHPDTPLDKPDQFLYDLSLIPDYAERIFCFIFREAFQDSISVIETKMTNLRMTCQSLMTSIHVKRILGLVLGLGNYMNGGSKSRGQADGFGIEILPKLKDVKSKDNSMSLLHYAVQHYIKKFERQDAGTDKVKFPLPDPSDLTQGCQVSFDELDKELRRIKKDFEAAEERADKVIKSAREHLYLQPFKDIMTEFFEKGKHEFIEQEENLADGKRLFQETVIYFCVKPKSGDKEVTPEYFFSSWCTFCQDFKDTWKREQQKIIKIRIKENEVRVKQMQQRLAKQPVRTRTRKAGGLKDRLKKQGLLDS